jgi:3-oxoacyl-[acyl-carrier-protein] synthase-3
MKHESHIGLSGLGTALPEHFVPLAELALSSDHETLCSFGFEGAYVADDIHELCREAAERALADAGLTPGEIDALIFAGALPQTHRRASEQPSSSTLDEFCYTASWLHERLALGHAEVCAIAQQGCAGMFSALRHARALLIAEPALNHVLCVGGDALPSGAGREVLYNVISDAACAVVVSNAGTRLRWRGFHQISKGYYWDIPAKQSEIIAAYFPTSRGAIQGVLARTGLRAADIDLVIPTGVNASSWPILLRLCGIAEERLYQPRRRIGHTIAADPFIFLEEARATGCLHPGMRVLLFTYGFGSSWCALIVEVDEEAAR